MIDSGFDIGRDPTEEEVAVQNLQQAGWAILAPRQVLPPAFVYGAPTASDETLDHLSFLIHEADCKLLRV